MILNGLNYTFKKMKSVMTSNGIQIYTSGEMMGIVMIKNITDILNCNYQSLQSIQIFKKYYLINS